MIRFGVLGLGNIAHRFCRSLIQNPEAELYAVASSSQEKQQQFKDLYGAKWSCNDYQALIDHPEVDVVYVSMQHKDHARWVKQCLLSHKAVICEKPMALSYEETKNLITLAKAQNTFLMEALKTYFIPGVEKLVSDIQSGVIGEVVSVEASFESDVPYMPNKYLYEKGQGGSLNDVAIYPLSFVLKVINEPITKIDVKYRQHPLAVVDSYFEAIFDYASHKKATISGAIDCNKEKQAIIVGTKGTIVAPYYYRVTDYTIKNDLEVVKRHVDLCVDDMQGEINEVIQCVKSKQIESSIYTFEKMLEMALIQDLIREQVVLDDK